MDSNYKKVTGNVLRNANLAPGITQANITKEKSAIDHELELLQSAIGHAHELMSRLEAASAPVSSPTLVGDNESPGHESLGSSRVYFSIHEAVNTLYALSDRVLTVLNNLEV